MASSIFSSVPPEYNLRRARHLPQVRPLRPAAFLDPGKKVATLIVGTETDFQARQRSIQSLTMSLPTKPIDAQFFPTDLSVLFHETFSTSFSLAAQHHPPPSLTRLNEVNTRNGVLISTGLWQQAFSWLDHVRHTRPIRTCQSIFARAFRQRVKPGRQHRT
jgi:hypothetical protein